VQAARRLAPHLTVVAHSYGSTTAGLALRDTQTGTDDVVLVGSPVPGSTTPRTSRSPAGHVFVGANSRDPVSYVDRFGADPAYESFGAVRFEAEAVGGRGTSASATTRRTSIRTPSRWPTSRTS
jgi:pimeloyl-ACP methyl ester carboxylesterase